MRSDGAADLVAGTLGGGQQVAAEAFDVRRDVHAHHYDTTMTSLQGTPLTSRWCACGAGPRTGDLRAQACTVPAPAGARPGPLGCSGAVGGDEPGPRSGQRRRRPTVREVLAAAVASLGGHERPGQVQMAEAVADAMTDRTHLLVQAGTGTGKSLGYLVPALLHDDRVVVATATLALQHQLVERDLPAPDPGRPRTCWRATPSYAVLKGRAQLRLPAPHPRGRARRPGRARRRCRRGRWARRCSSCAPGPRRRRSAAARATATPRRGTPTGPGARSRSRHRECLGAARCPFGDRVLRRAWPARRRRRADVIVTNHSMLAIDAIEGVPMIPEYDVVVVDEAHELTARVTQASTDELHPDAGRAGRPGAPSGTSSGIEADDLGDAAEALRDAIAACAPGRIDTMPDDLADALALVRDAARALVSGFGKETGDDAGRHAGQGLGAGGVRRPPSGWPPGWARRLWATDREAGARRTRLCVAPLQVWGPLRDQLLADKTVVFTSATLKLGGDFDALAGDARAPGRASGWPCDAGTTTPRRGGRRRRAQPWRGHRRRLAVRLRQAGHPVRRRAPAATGSRRARAAADRRDRRPGRRRRRAHAGAVLEPAGRRRPPPRRCASGCRT